MGETIAQGPRLAQQLVLLGLHCRIAGTADARPSSACVEGGQGGGRHLRSSRLWVDEYQVARYKRA